MGFILLKLLLEVFTKNRERGPQEEAERRVWLKSGPGKPQNIKTNAKGQIMQHFTP